MWMNPDTTPMLSLGVYVGGARLAFCSAIDLDQMLAQVDLAEPRFGQEPVVGLDKHGNEYTQWIRLALTVQGDSAAPFLYWTGEGWLDALSRPVVGPPVTVVSEHVTEDAQPQRLRLV